MSYKLTFHNKPSISTSLNDFALKVCINLETRRPGSVTAPNRTPEEAPGL